MFCMSVDMCSYVVGIPPCYQHLQANSQILQWGFSVLCFGYLWLWLLASSPELSRLLMLWSGAGRGITELPDASPQPSVQHGWCTTLWPNSPITEGLKQKLDLHFFFISTEKPGNMYLRDINTCSSAKN